MGKSMKIDEHPRFPVDIFPETNPLIDFFYHLLVGREPFGNMSVHNLSY
jgi:hypothetical protein